MGDKIIMTIKRENKMPKTKKNGGEQLLDFVKLTKMEPMLLSIKNLLFQEWKNKPKEFILKRRNTTTAYVKS